MRNCAFILIFLALMLDHTVSGQESLAPLKAQATLNRMAYAPHEPVIMRLEVHNPSNSPVRVFFPSSQRFDFSVRKQSHVVWRWSHGKAFLTVVQSVDIQPGSKLEYSATWNQQSIDGTAIGIGVFEAEVVFLGALQAGGPVSNLRPIRFSIGPSGLAISARGRIIGGRDVGEVLIAGKVILRIRVAAGGISAGTRAKIVAERLWSLVAHGLQADQIRVVWTGREAALVARQQLIVTADLNHARLNSSTPVALAELWKISIVQALSAFR